MANNFIIVQYRTVGTPVPDETNPALNAGYDNQETGFYVTTEEDWEMNPPDPEVIKEANIIATLSEEQLKGIVSQALSFIKT